MLFLSLGLHGVEISGSRVILELAPIDGFKLHKDFLGLPYVFIKSEDAGKQSSISVTPTGITNIVLKDDLLKGNYDQYKDGRRKWAEKRGFSHLAFTPFRSFYNASKAKIISAGYSYRKRDGGENREKSYYVLCPREMFQIKSLATKAFDAKLEGVFESILQLSRCKNRQ